MMVDVSRLDRLKDIAIADDGLHIGALATHTEIMRSPTISGMFPALVEAAHSIGAMQTRISAPWAGIGLRRFIAGQRFGADGA